MFKVKSGDTFDRLVVVALYKSNNHQERLWVCQCSCGRETTVTTHRLLSGKTSSCGCKRIERIIGCGTNFQHGHTRHRRASPTYTSWGSMKNRCYNQKHDSFPYYGGRGIIVCNRWLHNFKAFLADMGERPEGMTIDRRDSDGNYEPGNCRWATAEQQNNNKRKQLIKVTK